MSSWYPKIEFSHESVSPLIQGPSEISHEPVVISRQEFLQYGRDDISDNLPSNYYDYLRTRFHIMQRNIGASVMHRFDRCLPEPIPLRFTTYPKDKTYSWRPSEIDGLIVASVLESFEPIVEKYNAAESQRARQQIMTRQLGYQIGPTGLKHIVGAAHFFLNHPFQRIPPAA